MQVQNNKEEIPFAHYEEKFASLDPQEAARALRRAVRRRPVHCDAAGDGVSDRVA